MRYGSVCSGIEAATVAWHPLGWQAAWLSEIEPFPSAVLAHHYPDVPNLGDMTLLPERIAAGEVEAPDLFCGGTPCQAFSVAGLRKSLDDARGNLSLTFCEIANAIDHIRSARGEPPAIIFWENVPGVLNTKDNAFGCFLAGLAGEDGELVAPGGKWPNAGAVYGPQRAIAWRVLDAQYFGVAQRRRRVFVVASARDDFDPAAVLLEFDGLRRDSAPSRQAGQAVTPTIRAGAANGGAGHGARSGDSKDELIVPVVSTLDANYGRLQGCSGQDANHGHSHLVPQAYGGNNTAGSIDVATARNACASASGRMDFESETFLVQPVTHSLRGEGFDASEDGTGRGTPLVPVAFAQNSRDEVRLMGGDGGIVGALAAEPGMKQTCYIAQQAVPIGLDEEQNAMVDAFGTLKARTKGGGFEGSVMQPNMQVRRLTPVECERLQGFPDHYTEIPWRKKPAAACPDGPRYKALGNSWAVPNVRWIGHRIALAVAISALGVRK